MLSHRTKGCHRNPEPDMNISHTDNNFLDPSGAKGVTIYVLSSQSSAFGLRPSKCSLSTLSALSKHSLKKLIYFVGKTKPRILHLVLAQKEVIKILWQLMAISNDAEKMNN